MNLALFSAALLMTVVAMGFVTTPLLVSSRRRDAGSAKLSLLGVIVVFVLGIVLYGVIGQPQFSNVSPPVDTSATAAPAIERNGGSEKSGSVASLLSGLETRLAENPDDAKGWLLLAKSYDHLGRNEDARDAYEKAAALGMTDATLESRLSGASAPSTTTSTEAAIHGQVRVDGAAASQVDPGDVVYVVAKTDGNPMPLAVLRHPASELPFEFVLSDANSMVKGGGISSAATVVVSARLSKTGNALEAAALTATSAAIDPRASGELNLILGK